MSENDMPANQDLRTTKGWQLAGPAAPPPEPPANAEEFYQLLEKIESYYDFACTGGPLHNCEDWRRLKAGVIRVLTSLPRLHCCASIGRVPLSPSRGRSIREKR